MTTATQFTLEELRTITDALTTHVEQIRKLYPPKQRQPGSEPYERNQRIIDLSVKITALIKRGERQC